MTSGPHEHAERVAEIRRRAEAHVVYPLTRDEALWLCDALDEKILTHTADEWLSHRFNQEYERAKSALAELEQAKKKLAREQARKRAAKADREQALDLLAACWDELGRDQYYVDPALRKQILALVSERIKNDVHGFLAGP